MRNAVIAILLVLMGAFLSLGALTLGAADEKQSAERKALDPHSAQTDSVRQATLWLVRAHQNDDGGYASFSAGAGLAPSTVGGTLDAMLALASAGYPLSSPFPGRATTPIGFLKANPEAVVDYAAADGSQAGKLVLGLTAAQEDPRLFLGHNFVLSVTQHLSPSGAFGVQDAFKQSLAMLALAAAREEVPEEAIAWLIAQQAPNGSWDDGFGTVDNPDATGMSIMALLAAGKLPDDPAVTKAAAFLADSQLDDGSWAYGTGFDSSLNSTALAAQALSALGEDWYSGNGSWAPSGNAPLAVLLAAQSASGAFQADFGQGPFDDFFTTAQVVPAVAGRPYPLPARFEAAQAGLACLASLQDGTVGGWEQFSGGGVDAGGTSRAIQAIAAAGGDPQDPRWTPAGGPNAVDALEALAPAFLTAGRGGRVGIVLQGVVAAGAPYDPEDFAGEDLLLTMSGYLSPTGAYDNTAFGIFAHAEAMLGLMAAGGSVDPSAIELLRAAQTDGDWGDNDQNGIAIHVLGLLGESLTADALEVLRASQMPNGSWDFAGETSLSATSEIVQGLVAAGQNPFGPAWSKLIQGSLQSPADQALALQQENGCWPGLFGPGDDPYTTTDAIILLSAEPEWGISLAHLPVVQSGP